MIHQTQETKIAGSSAKNCSVSSTDLHLAAILLNRHEPLAPHHVGWIRERLGYMTDEELVEMVRTGKLRKLS